VKDVNALVRTVHLEHEANLARERLADTLQTLEQRGRTAARKSAKVARGGLIFAGAAASASVLGFAGLRIRRAVIERRRTLRRLPSLSRWPSSLR
jgi:hypothetical protein